MLPSRLRLSSAGFATLIHFALTVSCGNSGGSETAQAMAGASMTASAGHSGLAEAMASGGTTATADGTATAGESAGGARPAGDAGGTTEAAGGAVGGSGASTVAGAVSAGSGPYAGAANSSGGADTSGGVPSSDTFDGTTLDASWLVFRPELADIALADGSLSIAPHSGALWYQASQADLVYKLVTGNFKATTTVHARQASDRSQTPAQFADVGGIMARNPSGASENYILGVVGYAEMNELAVEHKSTTNGKSVYGEVAFTPDAEFRMCRVGSTFTIYYRHPGEAAWGPAFDPFERPDLPATVQVGAIAYTGATGPDFVAIFDNFTFEPLGGGCSQ